MGLVSGRKKKSAGSRMPRSREDRNGDKALGGKDKTSPLPVGVEDQSTSRVYSRRIVE